MLTNYLICSFIFITQPLKLGKILLIAVAMGYEQMWSELYTILYGVT